MDHHFPPNPADQYYNYQPRNYMETPMPDVGQISSIIMDLGIPACVIFASFWFIRFQSIEARTERENFWAKDEEHDNKLLEMVQKSSDVHLQVKIAIEQMTQAIKESANWKR